MSRLACGAVFAWACAVKLAVTGGCCVASIDNDALAALFEADRDLGSALLVSLAVVVKESS